MCPGLETKTHLAGSTDSNKCIEAIDQSSDYFRKLIFQTIFIGGINLLLSGFDEEEAEGLLFKIEPLSSPSESRDAQSPMKRLS